jgi:HSP20 family protein
MSVMRWNPIREMIEMQRAVDRAFNENFFNKADFREAWSLPVDAYATEDAIVLVANVPGIKPDDLNITLEGDTLTIRGEIKAENDKRFLLRERVAGKFERVLTISTPVEANKVEATFENGVLTLTLPKAEAVKPRTIQIKANQN